MKIKERKTRKKKMENKNTEMDRKIEKNFSFGDLRIGR